MASTNHTQYYNLPQYIGTDKPTYLVDFNQAMASIDAGIHAAKIKADNNENNITTLTGTVGGLSTTVGQHTTSIGNINTDLGNIHYAMGDITNLNTTDKSNLVSAVNEVNIKASNFLNFTSITTYEANQMTYTSCNAGTNTAGITVALDENKEYAKIYTQTFTTVNKTSTGEFYITIPDIGFRPSASFTVGGAGISNTLNSGNVGYNIAPVYLTFNTNGTVEVHGTVFSSSGYSPDRVRIFLHNSVIVLKDFSDAPQPE